MHVTERQKWGLVREVRSPAGECPEGRKGGGEEEQREMTCVDENAARNPTALQASLRETEE